MDHYKQKQQLKKKTIQIISQSVETKVSTSVIIK